MMDQTITDKEFEKFRTLVYEESGINLNDGKKPLVISRLSKRLRALRLDTFQAYYDHVVGDPTGEEFTKMLDLLSTHKTDFVREPAHFNFLRERIMPGLARERRIRIWSAACSSGEEPYSIAMTVFDAALPMHWDCKILASDLSTRVLAKATRGVYGKDRVANMPAELVRRHFLKGKDETAGRVLIKSHLSNMVVFRRINLMDDRYPIRASLDVIFCRNVMIYFDKRTQEQLLAKFCRYLKPGGYLFVGHSESLQWLKHSFRYVAPTIYVKEK